MLGPSAGTPRCIENGEGRPREGADPVWIMGSGVCFHERKTTGPPTPVVAAARRGDSRRRRRDAASADQACPLHIERCRPRSSSAPGARRQCGPARRHLTTGKAGLSHEPEAFAGVRIQDRQDPNRLPHGQRVVHEVHRPPLVGPCGGRTTLPRARAPMSLGPSSLQRQLLIGGVQPVDPLVIHAPALSAKPHMEPPICTGPAPAATSRSRLRKSAWDGRPDWYWILECAYRPNVNAGIGRR
jgi:hypothetical protein